MFGHITNKCQNETKCPHCAGTHKHAQCNNKSNKKCANCNGGQGAAYKGCPVYHKYANKINNVINSRKQTDKTETPITKLTTKKQPIK